MQAELDQSQLDEVHQMLEALQIELETLLHHGKNATRPVTLDQQTVGRISRIDAIQQQQMALANREQAQQTLKQVELAMLRIEAGEYGYCLQCDLPIPFTRLKAKPVAQLCVECQSAIENN